MGDRIRQWIEDCLDKGYSPGAIKKRLGETGGDIRLVDEVLTGRASPIAAPAPAPAQPQNPFASAAGKARAPPGRNIFSRFWAVLFSPKQYFESIRDEQGYGTPAIYYVVFVILPTIIGTMFSVSFISQLKDVSVSYSGVAEALVSNVGFSVMALFLAHIFVSLFGGKYGFSGTFKAVIYPSGALAAIMAALQVGAVQIGSASAFLAYGILIFVAGLYVLQLELWAFERLQGISQWKAFIALILSGILFVAIRLGWAYLKP